MRVGLIYLLSGFGGSILSSLFIQHNISVGASGALFGLLGAMLSELLTNWSIYTNKVCCFSGQVLECFHCDENFQIDYPLRKMQQAQNVSFPVHFRILALN